MLGAGLFTITKNWGRPKCPSIGDGYRNCDIAISWNTLYNKKELITDTQQHDESQISVLC